MKNFKYISRASLKKYLQISQTSCFGNDVSQESSPKCFAAICETYGEKLVFKENDSDQKLGKNDIAISSRSSALTFADLLMCQGKYQIKPPTPFIAGREICGKVINVGEEVKSIRNGDKVFGFLPGSGAFTNNLILPKENCFVMPQSMDYRIGSALYTSYITAYLGLVHKAHIKSSDKVLITGAGGAVGLAAVDICANVYKSKVIGVTGSAEKSQAIRDKGAFATIEYHKEKIKETVMGLTDKGGVDLAFDTVGGPVFEDCLKSLAFDGRLLVVGFASGLIPDIKANRILLNNNSLIGFTATNYFYRQPEIFRHAFDEVTKFWEQKDIEPRTADQTFSLEQINDAIEYIKSRKAIGKVIISPDPPSSDPKKSTTV